MKHIDTLDAYESFMKITYDGECDHILFHHIFDNIDFKNRDQEFLKALKKIKLDGTVEVVDYDAVMLIYLADNKFYGDTSFINNNIVVANSLSTLESIRHLLTSNNFQIELTNLDLQTAEYHIRAKRVNSL